jgi:Proteasome subunit
MYILFFFLLLLLFSSCLASCSTVLGICGPDYAIVAGDTRLSEGYSISSRTYTKVIQLYVSHALLVQFSLSDLTRSFRGSLCVITATPVPYSIVRLFCASSLATLSHS